MNTDILVSIIVPVYKAEEFLPSCINSVLNQTYTNWELLLVDDGSPDKCPSMCDQWAEKDLRIKVFHKTNGGVSSARNIGLENMLGNFVTFLDSDDCLMPDCLEKCIFEINRNDLDIVQFYFLEVFPDGRIFHHNRIETKVCTPEEYIQSGQLSGCSCGGVYSANIIRNNNIRYNEHLRYLEDAFFVSDIIKCGRRMKRISGEYYEYHKNPNGSDKPKDWGFYLDSIEYAGLYKKSNSSFGIMIDGWCTMLAMRYISLAPKHNFPRFSKVWRDLNVSKEYLKNAGRRDVVLFDKIQRIIGVRFASYITKAIHKVLYGTKISK